MPADVGQQGMTLSRPICDDRAGRYLWANNLAEGHTYHEWAHFDVITELAYVYDIMDGPIWRYYRVGPFSCIWQMDPFDIITESAYFHDIVDGLIC